MGKPRTRRKRADKRPAKPAARRSWPFRALAWVVAKSLKWGTVAAVWGLIGFLGLAAWYGTALPDVEEAFNAARRPTVTLVAADGSELMTAGDVYGATVSTKNLPPALVHAVLATEDRRFYDHFGLDVVGLARAMLANARAGRIVQGGSTITQQVAKNLFLTPERTVKRKVQELLLALWLEHRFGKDQILAIYLNRVYLGNGTYGVDAAARKYFGRPVARLTTYESAMLAGLLKAPSRYNPIADQALADARTRQVLRNMIAAGYLTAAEAANARAGRRAWSTAAAAGVGRHFADWVLDQVSDYVNAGDRDLVVVTTLDARLQRRAEGLVAAMVAGPEAAVVAMAPGGAVRAMVGGRSYPASQFNRATQARRQPGSAFKPVVYLAGLEAGLTPSTVMVDGPVTVGGWSPSNFSGRYDGAMTLAEALKHSVNTVAVKVGERAGWRRVVAVARRLGLAGDLPATPSLALGAGEVTLLELTSAYAAFANRGGGVWAYGIEEIRDRAGNVLYRRRGSGPGRVVADDHVAAINAMLAGVIADGTGRAADFGRPAAGKTGTSQNFRDAWFVGYSADLACGVWMGNDNDTPMKGVTGGGAPARLWRQVMSAAHARLPVRPLPGLDRGPPATAGQPGFWGRLFGSAGGDSG